MTNRLKSYPMIVLLLPVVAAILLIDYFVPKEVKPEGEQTFGFIISGAPKPTAKCERFETQLLSGEKVFLYLLRDSTKTLPTFGDTVVTKTTIEWYRNSGRAFASRYLILPAKKHKIPLRIRLYNRLSEAGLEGNELATIGALTLGYKEDLDPEVKRHFQASGAAHVLAVSGLHTGIIYALLLGLLTLFGHVRPMHENWIGRCSISLVIIAIMWGYAWLTGMTPSVVRAVVMVSLVEIGRMAYRNSLSINTIAAAAVLILLVRPSDLWSVSFQLSFAATFAIVFLAQKAERLLHRKEGKRTWYQRLLAWIIGTVIISLAAQLGTLPITMYYFGQISTYFLLTNLIVLPLATLLVPCGLISIALGGSWCGVLFSKITFALSWAMNHSVGWIEHLPGSTVQVHIGLGMVAIYYGLLIAFFIALDGINCK